MAKVIVDERGRVKGGECLRYVSSPSAGKDNKIHCDDANSQTQRLLSRDINNLVYLIHNGKTPCRAFQCLCSIRNGAEPVHCEAGC
jgi:hypothetical protein